MQKQTEREIESALSKLADAGCLMKSQAPGSPAFFAAVDDDDHAWYLKVDVGSLPEGVLGAVRFLDPEGEALILISNSLTEPTVVKGVLLHEVAHVLRGPGHSDDDEALFGKARALASECGNPALPVTPDELCSFLEVLKGGSL